METKGEEKDIRTFQKENSNIQPSILSHVVEGNKPFVGVEASKYTRIFIILNEPKIVYPENWVVS